MNSHEIDIDNVERLDRCQYCDEVLNEYNPYQTCELCMDADRVENLPNRLADIIRQLKKKRD